MPSHLDTIFWSMFHRFLLPTWIPGTQFGDSGLAYSWFFRFRGNIDLGSEFGANMASFFSKNPAKSSQKSIPRGINVLIGFCIDFYSIFLRFGMPIWSYVGHFFAQNTAALFNGRVVCVRSMLFFDFWVVLGFFWLHFGLILEGSGLHFGGFWLSFFWIFVRSGETFVRTVLASGFEFNFQIGCGKLYLALAG